MSQTPLNPENPEAAGVAMAEFRRLVKEFIPDATEAAIDQALAGIVRNCSTAEIDLKQMLVPVLRALRRKT